MTELPTWPVARAAEALEAVARHARLPIGALPPSLMHATVRLDDQSVGPWLDACAARLGLEAEPIRASYAEAGAIARTAGPAVLASRGPEPRLVALIGARGRRALVAGPDHGVVAVDPAAIEDALWAPIDRAHGARADAILARAGVPERKRARARAALVREPFAGDPIDAGWLVRLPPSAPFRAQAKRAALFHTTARMLAATILADVLGIVAWWLIGQGALGGTLDWGWMAAWALLLLTMIPVRVVGAWWQGLVGVTLSALLKQRLLVGALRLDAEEVRGQGTGQILGRVIESEAVESLALSGGFAAALASVQLALAAPVLLLGAGGLFAFGALVAWTALALALALRYGKRAQEWAASRVRMTDDLVERMVGHRTRVAQERPEGWHDDEDRALAEYLDRSARFDATSTLLGGLLSRGWTIVGLLAMVPAFLAHGAAAAPLAVGVGGVLLARGAFQRLVGGMSSLASAQVAWRQVAPIFHAAGRAEEIGTPTAQLLDARDEPRDEPLLVAHDITFRYRPAGEPILKKITVRIDATDRVLLEGPSGGGKSTLGSILSGLRAPESGLLLLDGLDRPTLGVRGWRRRVVAAPQFHENHVLSNTLAFNLLMGRRWPPRWQDLQEATKVCRELGLGPLLQRMPGGMQQMVGETGWQLSHGERSRVFIARALLQEARLIVLDESFAALDPETLAVAMRCVLARAKSLVVIAHP